MTRARFAVAATVVATATIYASAMLAAQAQAPPMTQVLAGKKLTPPYKGEALIEFTQPVTKRVGDNVVTTIKVRNQAAGPVARLQVTETWYGADNSTVTSGKGTINGMIQPGEIQTIEIRTQYNAKMRSNNWNFAHANGSVKVAKVKTLDAPATPAAAPAKK